MSSSQAIIVGASSQGKVVLEILRAQGVDVLGFVDDAPASRGQVVNGVPVLGPVDSLAPGGHGVVVAIGNNVYRTRVGQILRKRGVRLVNAVHPSAVIMPSVVLGSGVVVAPGAILMTGVRVEDDVVVNTGVSVDHDGRIERGAYLAPGVRTAGAVRVGPESYVAIGALLGPGVHVGERAVVGAGSVVIRDVPSRVLAFGAPAKTVRTLDDAAFLDVLRATGGIMRRDEEGAS